MQYKNSTTLHHVFIKGYRITADGILKRVFNLKKKKKSIQVKITQPSFFYMCNILLLKIICNEYQKTLTRLAHFHHQIFINYDKESKLGKKQLARIFVVKLLMVG